MITHAPDARELAGYERLLALLFAKEPDDELRALMAGIPELAAYATPEAAGRHTHVLVLNAYPFASVYLDEGGALHGRRAAFTRDVLRALGLQVEGREGMAADHVSVALDALVALLEREADAAGPLEARRARHAQRTVLAEHLLPWAPSFLGAVQRVDEGGLYGAAAGLARKTLVQHARRLDEASTGEAPAPTPTTRADAATDEAEEPGENGAVAWLASPARCGMFLSRHDLAVLGASAGIPTRIGGRRFVLEAMVRAAHEEAEATALTRALSAFASARRAELQAWMDEAPAYAGAWRPWLATLDATRMRLEEGVLDGAGSL
ncbi:MAG: molecular chaperone TorD family protein [Trueperaceae bacterium]|nr:molecular chaperone TorD family protein [Trueperaceae bacterium]